MNILPFKFREVYLHLSLLPISSKCCADIPSQNRCQHNITPYNLLLLNYDMWEKFFLKENFKARWIFAIGAPIYVIIFYVFLEPRKNDLIPYSYRSLDYSLITITYLFLFIFMVFLLPKAIPSYFDKKNWSFKKFNLWFIFLCVLGFLLSMILDFEAFDISANSANIWKYFVDYQLPTDLFAVIPIYIFFMFDITNLMSNKKPETSDLNEMDNLIPIENTPSVFPLIFVDQNEKNVLEINSEQLLYITTSDNYVDIFYKKNQNIERQILRNTLKGIEEQHNDAQFLFRCHKTYIVNMQKVIKIEGNAKGYFFVLEHVEDKIPISRNKNEELMENFPRLFSRIK